MKRVVLIRSNPVNPDPPVEKMANTLLRNGYKVMIVAWDRSNNDGCLSSMLHFSNGDVEIIRFGIRATYGGGLKKSFMALSRFQYGIMKWLFVNRDKYDIVHAFDFDTGFIASICARILKKKLVYHILDYYVASHNLSGGLLGRFVEYAEIGVINYADATIVCTEKRKEQICKAKPRKLFVIHNTPNDCVIDDACITRRGCREKASIVFVGTFGRDRFLREVVGVIKRRNDIELHIGGFGELDEEIRTEAASNKNMYYYGRLSYEKTLALEKQCDIMFAMYTPAVPNHRYSAPNKFYEALMLGKPIIMARDTGFDDIIHQYGIGEITEYSEEGFNMAIDCLLAERSSWPEMKTRARDLYDTSYSWTIMEKRIVELYSAIDRQMES